MGYQLIENSTGDTWGYFKSRNKCREFAAENGLIIGNGPGEHHWEECPAPPTDYVEDNGDNQPQ